MTRRVESFRPPLGDVAITVAVAVFVAGATTGAANFQHDAIPLDPFGYLWLLAGVLPLPWRRRAPATVLLLTGVLVLGYYASGFPRGPSIVSPTIALITATLEQGPLRAGVLIGAVLLADLVAALVAGNSLGAISFGGSVVLLWATAAISVGVALRAVRTSREARRNEVAESMARRMEQERLGIAREVHDVVAHSLAMINVQAGTAAHVADRNPEAAKAALTEIKEASRTALNDLRATLAVLRTGSAENADTAPTAGLDRLTELTASAGNAGLTVHTEGEPGELPTTVDSTAYRILQESLTNVVKHAHDASEVHLRFDRTDDALELTVTDNGHPSGGAHGAGNGRINGTGNGLRGMHERADALGGAVHTSRGDDGGFVVHARLPIFREDTT